MKKRILFVYPEMLMGGSTTNLISILRLLDREKYELYLQLYHNRGPMLGLIPSDVHILPEASTDPGKLRRYIKMFFKGYLTRAIRLKGPDDPYFSQQIMSEFLARELSSCDSAHYDYAVGCLEGWADRYAAYCVQAEYKYGWFHSVIDRIAPHPELELTWMREMDRIISVTEPCNQLVKEIFPAIQSKSVYLENIADDTLVRERANETPDPALFSFYRNVKSFKIITVCRLDLYVKGLDRIVNAAVQLKKQGTQFLWLIVGDGPGRAELEQLIRRHKVDDCLKLAGQLLNPYPYIKCSDLMCMPSRWEGKPFSVTESMMLGVPPVITEYLSAKEQVTHQKDGFIAPNTEDGFVEYIRYAISHPKEIQAMHHYLLEQNYGTLNMIQKIEEYLF